MVIDIIMIKKVKNDSSPGNKKYPPAVVAMLVCSIFQFFWCIFYLVRSGKGLGLRASSIAGTIIFFLLFNVGTSPFSLLASFVLRYISQARLGRRLA